MIIYQEIKFDAAHRLLGYDGNCSNLHGHTWRVEVWLEGTNLDSCGMLTDYRSIKEYFKKEYDHRCLLNDQDPIAYGLILYDCSVLKLNGNPTAENLAGKILTDLDAVKVRVHESEANYAEVSQ